GLAPRARAGRLAKGRRWRDGPGWIHIPHHGHMVRPRPCLGGGVDGVDAGLAPGAAALMRGAALLTEAHRRHLVVLGVHRMPPLFTRRTVDRSHRRHPPTSSRYPAIRHGNTSHISRAAWAVPAQPARALV